eukprot:CAMPEP_0174990790 /NCGR_PEP_ID=MMETSP0004_2-20121128/21519_1 /TAXON_ID=420556 /ORGANISM="Ochromonas sp., Strain CCMP1393" /LENGTH=505 /DNA_ID=CAMNT_0016244441 /DNA_START=116 /DNA_END=1633 /DNA_ORIENTATION=-
MAGIQKNLFLDRWEFFFPSLIGTQEPSVTGSDDKVETTHNDEESSRLAMLDSVDLDNLSVSERIRGESMDETLADGISSKSKKKRAKKKKAKAQQESKKALTWGQVEQICFTRSVGYDSVPNKGSYPLGLGKEEERLTCSVDEYFKNQQAYLTSIAREKGIELVPSPSVASGDIEKVQEINKSIQPAPVVPKHSVQDSPKRNGKKSNHSNNGTKDNTSSNSSGGYGHHNNRKRSNSTSSISSLDGEDNSAPQLVASMTTSHLEGVYCLETRQYDFRSGSSNPLFRPLREDERIALLTGDHIDIPHNDVNHASTNSNTNSTSGSSANSTNDKSESGINEHNSATAIHHHSSSANPFTDLNNELKMIKSSRDEGGCNCKQVKLDKLSVAKLRAELISNGHLIGYIGTAETVEKMSKAELTHLVRDVLKKCVICVTNDCYCVQNGLQCSGQLCACLRGGHRPGQAQSCANPSGVEVFEPERVKEYRANILNNIKSEQDKLAQQQAAWK